MRAVLLAIALSAVAGGAAMAQSSPPPAQSTPAAKPDDNPFPGELPKTDPAANAPKAGQSSGQSQGQGTAPANDDNPFPGDAKPALQPMSPGSSSGDGGAPELEAGRGADPNGDPVRSPDGQGSAAGDDGFSSSRSALDHIPMEDLSDAAPGKSTKNKTREQVVKEDIDVGSFYLDQKNWKAAQGRFAAAFALDGENEDAVWGLARAEREMHQTTEAIAHLKLFLSYDPDGPHSRAAKKMLEGLLDAQPLPTAASKSTGSNDLHPKLP
jgi:tetratricopeptide (TPR) repeat protein